MNRRARRSLPVLATAASLLALAVAGCGGGGGEVSSLPKNVSRAEVSWGQPGGDPKALVILLPGGGWQRSPSQYEDQKTAAKSLQQEGYATVAVQYDEGARGFRQIEDVYRTARKHYPKLPICATGISAGGHLALMLATREPDLACVVGLSAPTDLTTLAAQDPQGQEAYNAAVAAFGKDQLARYSPVRYANRIKAKVLLFVAATDPLDPVAQGRELTEALPGAQLVVLPPGPDPAVWAHGGGVQPNAQEDVVKRDLDFIDQATGGG